MGSQGSFCLNCSRADGSQGKQLQVLYPLQEIPSRICSCGKIFSLEFMKVTRGASLCFPLCTLVSPTFSRKPASVSHHAFPSAQFLVLHISLTLHNTTFCVLQLISCNLHFHILTKTLRQTRGRSFCPSNPTQYWP